MSRRAFLSAAARGVLFGLALSSGLAAIRLPEVEAYPDEEPAPKGDSMRFQAWDAEKNEWVDLALDEKFGGRQVRIKWPEGFLASESTLITSTLPYP